MQHGKSKGEPGQHDFLVALVIQDIDNIAAQKAIPR